jgi:hypothetical protein
MSLFTPKKIRFYVSRSSLEEVSTTTGTASSVEYLPLLTLKLRLPSTVRMRMYEGRRTRRSAP